MSYVDDFITLLVKAAKEETSQSEMEALRKQFLRMMTANNSTPKYTVPEVGTDSDKLDGQHGSYYRDASNMNAGTMSADRFSAYGDLNAETKIGTGAAQVAAGDHGHSHTALTDIGTNAHAQIDTHLVSTANPHTVTKAQVGLGSVANILDKLDATTAPTINDDSGDGYSVGSLWVDVTADQTYICVDATVGAAVWVGASSTDAAAIHDNVAGEIAAITEKTTPADADVFLQEDSAAGNAKKKISWANIKAALKSYFDTLYAVAAKGVTNGDAHNHSGGDGAQIDHVGLANKGTNTHATLDAFVASKAAASGLASLNASSLVVQNPANATATPTANKIPVADASGMLDGWISGALGCKVIRTTAQAISNNTITPLSFNSEIADIGNCWSITNPTRLYAPIEGYYMAGGAWSRTVENNPSASRHWVAIRVNGTTYVANHETHTIPNRYVTASVCTGMFYLSAGSYVEICALHDSGASRDADPATTTYQHQLFGFLSRIR